MASRLPGLVTFPREPGPAHRERIDELYPGLLDTLVSHPGIGFVMVDSEHGGVALGAEGLNYFEINDVEGSTLAAFGPNTAAHVLRGPTGSATAPTS